MQVKFSKSLAKNCVNLILVVTKDFKGKLEVASLDKSLLDLVSRTIKDHTSRDKESNIIALNLLNPNDSYKHIIIALLDKKKLSEVAAGVIGSNLYQEIKKQKMQGDVVVSFAANIDNAEQLSVNLAYGMALKAYSFKKYQTKKSEKAVLNLCFWVDDEKKANKLYKPYSALVDGVYLARDFILEPSNVLYPQSYAKLISDQFKNTGVSVKVLSEKELQKLNMNALLAVGKGSLHKPNMVVLEYNNSSKFKKPIVIVGKGITFDSGGISLKNSAGMLDMKKDMAGSAAVVGLFKVLALRGAKVNVVGLLPIAENMPSGNAVKPGDIIVSGSGKTIEILNTDAEGRLVLADAVWYGEKFYKPEAIIDIATLTGNVMMCLGDEYAGLFSDDEKLVKEFLVAGELTGEKLWRLPLSKSYDKMIDSEIADVANLSSSPQAGSITGAHFIKRFVAHTPYVHLDIAGTAWFSRDKPMEQKNATGFGVRLLNGFLAKFYE